MRGCERRGEREADLRPDPRSLLRSHRRPDLRSDRGFVTAESAVVLPVLVMFAMALVWGLLVVAAQIQCVDAARTGARAAARQDPAEAVIEVAREAAPRGATVTVGRKGDEVRVVVVAKPPVLRGLPFEVREEAVAVAEETVGEGT
ncbi:Flp pilus assembly protein TadG [Streptomyces sp. V4I8]